MIYFLKILENISPFCGGTDTPVLDWWASTLGFRVNMNPLVTCFIACDQWILQIATPATSWRPAWRSSRFFIHVFLHVDIYLWLTIKHTWSIRNCTIFSGDGKSKGAIAMRITILNLNNCSPRLVVTFLQNKLHWRFSPYLAWMPS